MSKEKRRRFSTRSKTLRLLSAEPERRYLTSEVIARAVTASEREMFIFCNGNSYLYGQFRIDEFVFEPYNQRF